MSSDKFFSEFSNMRLNMAVLQYAKHPSNYAEVDFYTRSHKGYYVMDVIWRDTSPDVFTLVSGLEALDRETFEDKRSALLRRPEDAPLKWALNRIAWTADAHSFNDAQALSRFPDPWFKHRMKAIERSWPLHPRVAGPIKRKARLDSSSAFAAMYVALRALEEGDGRIELAALARTAFSDVQGV